MKLLSRRSTAQASLVSVKTKYLRHRWDGPAFMKGWPELTTENETDVTEMRAEKPSKSAAQYSAEEDRAFLKLLREENAGYREKNRSTTEEVEKLRAENARMAAEHEAKLNEQATAFKVSNAKADLTAKALKAGLNDESDLEHFDMGQVEIGEDGKVKDADKVIEKLKKAKPHYFGSTSTTSVQSSPAVNASTRSPAAKDLSPKEWSAWKKQNGL